MNKTEIQKIVRQLGKPLETLAALERGELHPAPAVIQATREQVDRAIASLKLAAKAAPR